MTYRGDPEPSHQHHHALVIAGGEAPSRAGLDAAWPGWAAIVDDVIAADAGILGARELGLTPALLVGDLDSADPALVHDVEAAGIPVRRAATGKDESDAELAVLSAIDRGATRVTLLGALRGPRLDHELANVWLLAHPRLAGVEVQLLDSSARLRLVTASAAGEPQRLDLPGRLGAVVTLLPFGGPVDGVTTRGLRYPLRDESLAVGPARGLSNVRVAADAWITVRSGRLLVVESPFAETGLSSGA